jgi:hypothetical protein
MWAFEGRVMMTKRVCENCRWWSAGPTGYGYCHRRPPIVSNSDESFPSTHKSVWCGEWSNASITPEQEERQELTRRFAVAIMSAEYAAEPCLQWDRIWAAAQNMAAAEPQIQREE